LGITESRIDLASFAIKPLPMAAPLRHLYLLNRAGELAIADQVRDIASVHLQQLVREMFGRKHAWILDQMVFTEGVRQR
jgi:hypothetical protein